MFVVVKIPDSDILENTVKYLDFIIQYKIYLLLLRSFLLNLCPRC